MLSGCAASVSIAATRNPSFRGPLEPVTVVIFESNTGPKYTRPLHDYLVRELSRHRIGAWVEIITGAEYNEEQLLVSWVARSKGVVTIIPVGGTSYEGTLKEILYDVQVLEVAGPDQVRVVWRARLDSASGAYDFQIDDRLELVASKLVRQLIVDRVLPFHPAPAQ